MKSVTLSNAIQGVVALLFAIVALATAIITLTWWNGLFAAMGFALARVFYTDSYYGESVKQYIQRKRGK